MRKEIIATAVCCALLANTSMIATALDSNAETSVATETELVSESVKTPIVSKDSSEEASTTDTEELSPAELGAEVRKKLAVQVMDIIGFPGSGDLYDTEGNVLYTDPGWYIYIIGIDDVNQMYRVLVPQLDSPTNNCLFVKYADVDAASIVSHNGMVIGDLNVDGSVDVFDLVLMKRGFIYGWENRKKAYILSDMNADGEVSVADLIKLQKWLLGAEV